MKRRNDDNKDMGPMFPRLHVNDTEKGGPRAPPRNKMALYEQLTIPSQRYYSGVVPPKQNNSSRTSSLVPSTWTSQCTSREQNSYLNLHRPPPAPAYDEIQVRNTEGVSLNNQLVRAENKKRSLEEDGFMVPIFSQAASKTCNENKSRDSVDGQRHYLSSNHQGLLTAAVGEKTYWSNNCHTVSKQQIKDQDENTLRVSASVRTSLNMSMRERDDIPWQKDASLPREHQEKHRLTSPKNRVACLPKDDGGNLTATDAMHDEDVPDLQEESPCTDIFLSLRLNPQARCRLRGNDEINNGIVRIENMGKGNNVSETSMVDLATELDISPDDVVDIIGRKQFWKARSTIVNHQRLFAVQVFELHRLLKVQNLIAGSPNFLLEATAFASKSSMKGSVLEKYSSEFVMKDLPQKDMQKDVTHKTTDKVEGTAVNAVPKVPPPIPSHHHLRQPTSYPSFSANTALPPPPNVDPKMNPWGYHPPSSHQWLVRVMSPTEGLVYKPFPAPGFTDPVYGGCGPAGQNPVASNMMNPTHYQPCKGMPPAIHFAGQGYFHTYCMPMMNPSVSGSTMVQPNPYNPARQPVVTSLNINQENVIGSHVARSPARKEGEMQGSTASSSSDTTEVTGTVSLSEGNDKRTRVIRVVPHRSTRESVDRIFRSIQQERRV